MSRPDCCVEIPISELTEVVSRYNKNRQNIFLFRETSNDYTMLVEIDNNGLVMIRYPSDSEVEAMEYGNSFTDLRKYKV